MLQLPDEWAPLLVSTPETGMGYQVVSITLNDGSRYDQALIEGGYLTRIKGLSEIPFREDQIEAIVVTREVELQRRSFANASLATCFIGIPATSVCGS